MRQVIAYEDVFVGMFAVDGFIQADFFRHLADFYRREHIDNPEHGVGESERPDGGERYGYDFFQQEYRIAVEQAVRSFGVKGLAGEDTQHDYAEEAAHT